MMNGQSPKPVYLALGGNIRPRKHYIVESLRALRRHFPFEFKISPLYATRPYMEKSQPAYFNCCVGFITEASALDILQIIRQVEKDLGRTRSDDKWTSRSIDIDILFYGSELIDLPELIIPHYDVSDRDFFLMPMLDLEKSFVNPRTNLPLHMELQQIPPAYRTFPRMIKTRKKCDIFDG